MQHQLCKSLEEYILMFYLGGSLIKKVSNIYLDEGLEFISYVLNGESKVLPLDFYSTPSDMFLRFVYGDMIAQGYLLIPIENGWVVNGGKEDYYLDPEGLSCTCPASAYKGYCKHKLMLKGFFNIQTHISRNRLRLTSNEAPA